MPTVGAAEILAVAHSGSRREELTLRKSYRSAAAGAAVAMGLGTVAFLGMSTVPTSANAAELGMGSCRTSKGHTGGWAECKIRGTWRVKSMCRAQKDKYTSWVTTSGNRWVRVYANSCTFKITGIGVEIK
jgi:hypothetical protein